MQSTSSGIAPRPMSQLHEVFGVYYDAWLCDENSNLVFLSAWGRDAPIQELIARLSLADNDDGIDALRLSTVEDSFVVQINGDILQKQLQRNRIPLFGEMVHLFLFHKVAAKNDPSNGRAFLIDAVPVSDESLWGCIRELSHLPLLDHWRDPVLRVLKDNRWVRPLIGQGIKGTEISIDALQCEVSVSELVSSGVLTA